MAGHILAKVRELMGGIPLAGAPTALVARMSGTRTRDLHANNRNAIRE